MGTCPNCGNWVDDGDVCGVCGGSSSYSSDYEDEEKPYVNPRSNNMNSRLVNRSIALYDANKSFKRKDYKSTIAYCDMYLRTEGKELSLLLLKAKSLFELERYEEALDCCEDFINYNQKTEGYFVNRSHKSNGYAIWQLKGDCLLKFNHIRESIDSIENGLKLIKETFDKDNTHFYYSEHVQTERYQDLANLVASKLLALQILGEFQKAQDLYIEYAFIKIIEYPIFLEDKYSKEEYKLYLLIRKLFREKKVKLSLKGIVFPEKVVYCNNCGKQINYVRYIENKKVCPRCKKHTSFSNSEEEYEDFLKKEQEKIEQEIREKELREQNPTYLKNEIENQKKVFKTSRLILRLKSFQKNTDEKFKEILRLEELLDKCNLERKYSKDDIKQLKKENKRLKYCINHFEDKYTYNAKKLLEKNMEKIKHFEKENEEEKIIIKISD